MYYELSKILWFFATPSNVVLALVVAGAVLLMLKRCRAGSRLAVAGALCFLALGFLPVANWLLYPLEQRFPVWTDDGKPVAAIVVLGGAIEIRPSEMKGTLSLNESAERQVALGDLARRYPHAVLVFSGGAGAFSDGSLTESDIVEAHLAEFGLARDRVLFERRSRNTVENAAYTKQMLTLQPGDRVLLVTSAFHMVRSMALFRGAGLPVVAYPVDFRMSDSSELWRPFTVASDGLHRTDFAVREWIGLVAARLLGHSHDLFPAPEAVDMAKG
jgi:uncharacterized SAM-binding protein YcdF (DUF218 family)